MTEAQEQLQRATHAVEAATLLIKMEMPTIEAFLKECRDMDNFGHIVDPTLYRDSERRAVAAIVKPLFEGAADFVRTHDTIVGMAKAALKKVVA